MLQIRVWYSNGYRFTEIKYHSFFDLPTRANTLYTLLNKQSFIITHNRRKKWAIVAPDTHFKFSRFHWISRRFRSWCPSRWAIIRLVLCSLTSALLVLIFPCECFLTIRMVTVLSIRNQTLKHIPPCRVFHPYTKKSTTSYHWKRDISGHRQCTQLLPNERNLFQEIVFCFSSRRCVCESQCFTLRGKQSSRA